MFEIDDRVVVKSDSTAWPGFWGKHGLVRNVFNEESGYPVGKPIEVFLDGRPGGNLYFAVDELEMEEV